MLSRKYELREISRNVTATVAALKRAHKHLGAYLRMQATHYPDAWSTWLSFWCLSYNTTVHTETKYSPFELVFGQSTRLPSNT